MATPSAPSPISLNDVNVELGNPGTTLISLNDTDVRTLAGAPFGTPGTTISLNDLRGKSSFSATGGTKTTIGSYTYHDFTTPGPSPFVVTGSKSAFILLIAGGGGGSRNDPGAGGQAGGGAGGVIIAPLTISAGSYTVVVGSGGPVSPSHGGNGQNSTFGPNWVAQGGGGGLNYTPSPVVTQGGSPGGIYGNSISPLNQTNNPALPADSRTYGYGNQGGPNAGAGPPGYGGGGGGGAGGAGNASQPVGPGVGGAGLPTSPVPWLTGTPFFSPTSQFFAGGGGGASRVGNSAGGSGGGGAGGHTTSGTPGTTNTGSGGGGGFPSAGAGAPGRVIIAYLTA